jgi:four helix bundle protein
MQWFAVRAGRVVVREWTTIGEAMSDLKIQGVILETIAMLKPELARIDRFDADLARQMRRAAASMALNTSEGAYSRGGHKKVRFNTALGSARETLMCVEVAVRLGYVDVVRDDITQRMNQILGTLTNLAR